MLYPELFRQLEAVRWDMERDIPWGSFDASRLTDEQANSVKMNAITEWAALPATEMFLRDNREDSDFSVGFDVSGKTLGACRVVGISLNCLQTKLNANDKRLLKAAAA